MSLKKPLPLILSLLLLTRTLCAQMPMESKTEPNNAYGIESGKLYPGAVILRILEEVEEEIDAAVDEAYAAGYKAAALRYAPEAEYWKSLAESYKREAPGIKERLLFGLCGFALGGITMGIYGFARK